MPECSFHPGVETEVRCSECERPICPKDMVPTPVGYKCPICARPARGQYTYVKPRQYAFAAVASALAGGLGGLVLGWLGIGFLLLSLVWGLGVAEAVRRASGGHRGAGLAAVASGGIIIGGLLGGLNIISMGAAVLGAVAALSWTWGR
ncbi:MAG: hypothetical protein U1E29_08130 [Coriobacteriia bacterium]|nr:hypothetical protein [Coriobacteriia bacterium]